MENYTKKYFLYYEKTDFGLLSSDFCHLEFEDMDEK